MIQTLIEKRRRFIEEGKEVINSFRKNIENWNNSQQIEELLDQIEASKIILYSMCENDIDVLIIDVLESYNKILHELLYKAIINGKIN